MKYSKFSVILLLLSIIGCSHASNLTKENYKGAVRAISGTDTAIVGIPLDSNRAPEKSLLNLKIVVHPGQKIVFAGPNDFSIFFKDRKAPKAKQLESKSVNGVVIIDVPRDLLERPEFKNELEANKSVKFNFGIKANGAELDPQIIVIRRL